jgi:hypothetical protein
MKRFILVVAWLLFFFAMAYGVLAILAELFRPPSSILTSTECEPPCWYGIYPGESTSWEVMDVLLIQDWVIGRSINEWTTGDETTQIAWKFQRPAGDTAGYIYFQDDRVTAISISTIGSLNVSEAFLILGNPKSMVAINKEITTRQWIEINLIYPDDGFLVEVDIDLQANVQQNQVEITEDMHVYKIIYFDPMLYEDLMESRILIDESMDIITSNIQPWLGLGVVNIEGR